MIADINLNQINQTLEVKPKPNKDKNPNRSNFENDSVIKPVIFRLADLHDEKIINDFDIQIKLKRVNRPDGEPSSKVLLFFKNNKTSKEWSKDQVYLLSDRYTLVHTEKLIEEIKSNFKKYAEKINFEIGDPIYPTESIIRIPIKFTDIRFKVSENEKETETLFKLLFQDFLQENQDYQFVFVMNILNSFNGQLKLSFSASLNLESRSRCILKNYLIGYDVNKSNLHLSNIALTLMDISKAAEKIKNKITDYRSIKIKSKHLKTLYEQYLSKKQRDRFMHVWDNLDSNMKNLYYCTIVLSNYIEDSINRYLALQSFVKYVENN